PTPTAATVPSAADLPPLPIERASTQYYIDMEVADREGVIAEIAQVLATNHVSIESMRQPGVVTVEGEIEDDPENGAKIQIVTHLASERNLQATVEQLRGLDVVKAVNSVLRVEVEK
ncbi:MAG: homoserine dehydrogenase, partial [Nesterenkonia sp.]